jgi:AmmeMemoRadiSam system protein B
MAPVLVGPLQDVDPETGEERFPKNPLEKEEIRRFIDAARETIEKADGLTLIIASADLSHVGKRFEQDVHLNDEALEKLAESDLAILEIFLKGGADAFYQAVAENQNPTNICSLAGMFLLLKLLEGRLGTGELLDYRQSPEKERQEDLLPSSVVTFAAAAFHEKKD